MLKINLFGQIGIEYDGEDIKGNLSNKAIALMYMLIVNKEKFLTRDKIIFYLWPESSEDAAQYNLRYNLWILKKNIPMDQHGEYLIISDKDGCQINPAYQLKCDYLFIKNLDFETSSVDLLLQAAPLFRGEIMAGWYLKHCNEFNEMILSERFFCEQKHLQLLRNLAKKYETLGNKERALDVYLDISSIDCDDEDLALKVMKSYVEQGNRIAAINHYKKIEDILWHDLGITPNEELREYYESLLVNDPLILEVKSEKVRSQDPKTITIVPNEVINYFVVSQMIKAVTNEVGDCLIKSLDAGYIRDLALIQRSILISYNLNENNDMLTNTYFFKSNENDLILPIVLCNAMEYFLTEISKKVQLNFVIKDFMRCDNCSKQIIAYLKTLKVANFQLEI